MQGSAGSLQSPIQNNLLLKKGSSSLTDGSMPLLAYTAPTNYELKMINKGLDPYADTTIKDYAARNVGDLKNFKIMKI